MIRKRLHQPVESPLDKRQRRIMLGFSLPLLYGDDRFQGYLDRLDRLAMGIHYRLHSHSAKKPCWTRPRRTAARRGCRCLAVEKDIAVATASQPK